MGDHVTASITITLFLVFFSMVVITGDIASIGSQGDKMEEYNITEEDLSIQPDIPETTNRNIELDGYAYSENVEVIDSSFVNDTQYAGNEILRLQNNSETGYAIYSIASETSVVDTTSKLYSFFHVGDQITLTQYANPTENATPVDSAEPLSGRMSVNIVDDASYIRFDIPADQEQTYIYDITQKSGSNLGFFGTVSAYVNSFGNFVSAWFQLLTGLPSVLFWLGVALTLIGGLILIEYILW